MVRNPKAYWKPFNKAETLDNLQIVSGDGIYLYDKSNNRYIDAYSGLWNMHYGYSNNYIKDAIKVQLDKLPYINPILLNTEIQEELAQRLCELTHTYIKKIIYTCSGSESIEVAIKLCRKYASLKQRKGRTIAVLKNSYHGNYYGSMSASFYEGNQREGYKPLLEGFVELSIPICRCCKSDNISEICNNRFLETLRNELESYKDILCGIIIEPVIASGGVIALPEDYMIYLYQFCNENDIIFVCDEVATGFGRTGTMFAFQKYKVYPHLIIMSKGLNNGYLPLGAVCVSGNISDEFKKNDEVLFHLSTQNGNPICLAAAYANLELMKRDSIITKVQQNSIAFKEIFKKNISNYSSFFDIRIVGLMIAIDLIDSNTKEPLGRDKLTKLLQRIHSNGCLIGSSYVESITSSILIFPQFIIKKSEIIKIVKIINQAMAIEEL